MQIHKHTDNLIRVEIQQRAIQQCGLFYLKISKKSKMHGVSQPRYQVFAILNLCKLNQHIWETLTNQTFERNLAIKANVTGN